MKLSGKSRDGARDGSPGGPMDRLLRAYVSRPTNRECSEFDADLANAYIERSVSAASRSRYEQHLSECAACRKNVIALSRMIEPESRPLISARADSRFGGRQIFAVTSWPRWAMAAAAVIVLAISLPLLLTRNADRLAQEASRAVAESPAPDNTQAITRSQETSPAAAAKLAAGSSPAEEARRSEKRPTDTVSLNGPAPAQQPAGLASDRAGSGGKLEAKTEAKPVEQGQAGGRQVSDVATGQEQQEKRADKDDALAARQQQPSKDAEAAADTKSSVKEQDQQNAKEKTRVAENAAPPPPPAAPGGKVARLKRPSAIRALRDSSPAEAVRPTEKRVGGKKFLLKDNTWTDKDFDPDKDFPVVTIIHSSNVYNELLSKQAGLRPYLGGFTPAERAIIVYKGTVYKLIPQQSNQ